MEQPEISLDQLVKWMGADRLEFRMLQEQINLLSQENARLNKLLSTCKCERKDDENKG